MERVCYAKNGIPIYSYKNEDSHGFYLSLFLKSGSMYEGEDECGITHFFEHIAIRNINYNMGGTLYPVLDKYGLEFNASTYSEMVQFYLSGAEKNFGVAADILSRLFLPISLSRCEVDRERDRIRAEIREADEKTSLVGFTAGIVYGGTSLARQITGTPRAVSKITAKRLEEYRRRVFSPKNLFIYITGNVSRGDIERLAELVGEYPLFECEEHNNLAPVPQNFGKRNATVALKNADFTKVRFTFDLDLTAIATEEIDLLYDILLGGYSSGFFIELSENRGLFYDLSGQVERYRNIGTFSFSYELRESKLPLAVKCTVDELVAIKNTLLAPEKCMKAGYVDNAYMLLDDNAALNFTFAYDNRMLGLCYPDIAARQKRYALVTPERLMAAARKIFTPDNLTLTIKGNKRRIDTEEIRKILLEL